MSACERAGCDRPAHRRGLCATHYERQRDRVRDRSDRVLPGRARTRAVSRLIERHEREFRRLYDEALLEVTAEAMELERACAEQGDAEPTGELRKVWRYKPGPRPDDEEPADRVTRDGWVPDCRDCAAYHAAGHECATCSRPAPAVPVPAAPAPVAAAVVPGSREDVESRMTCSQCGQDGSYRRRPCVGVKPDGEAAQWAQHAYTLRPARQEATA